MKQPRSLADEWFDRPARPQPTGMSHEELGSLQQQIENLRERGSRGEDTRERLMELRRRHYKETGAAGG